jgi:hypothetical protein
MNDVVFFDLSSKRQLYDLIYHQESLKSGNPLEINKYEEDFEKLDVKKFNKAYEIVFSRHQELHAVFRMVNKEIKQVIFPYSATRFAIVMNDLSGMQAEAQRTELKALKKKIKANFNNLEAEFPLAQGVLFKRSPISYKFIFYCHHIIADGYSIKLFSDELLTVYENLLNDKPIALPPIELTCREFLLKRRQSVKLDYETKHFSYWEKKFSEYLTPVNQLTLYRTLELAAEEAIATPHKIKQAKAKIQEASWYSYTVPFENKPGLVGRAGDLNVSPSIVLMGCFFICAHICFGRDQVMAASTIPGRVDKSARYIIGNLFCNIFLKSNVHEGMTLKEITLKVYMDFLQSCRFPIFEFDKFDKFETRQHCEFFVNFLDLTIHKDLQTSEDLFYRHRLDKEYYSLSYIVREYKNGFTFTWTYQNTIYTQQITERMAMLHRHIVNAFIETADMTLATLKDMLSEKRLFQP